jgi:hypothetical protein
MYAILNVMKLIPHLIRDIQDRKERYFYRKRYNALKREFDALKAFTEAKVKALESSYEARVRELEMRVTFLENYREKTEGIFRVVDSLEPGQRRN